MYLDIDKAPRERLACVDDTGSQLTYGDLRDFCKDFERIINHRTLVFIMSTNTNASLLGYVACLNNKIVPLIISANTDEDLYNRFIQMYSPEYIWAPVEMELPFERVYDLYGYTLFKTGQKAPLLHDDLSMLLPTSGSTGSPKLVRHSYRNLEANAENVCGIFKIDETHRTLAQLPMHYTMGRSVIDSHLFGHATILLTNKPLTDKLFWKRLKEDQATSFTGVPYSYEILLKMRFERLDLPHLQIITQGGGKLTEELFTKLANYAKEKGKKFIPTYGQTECSARMTYLPAELASEKTCSIGIAEPNTTLSIIGDNGVETFEGEAMGEMVFRGENVTLGYATCADDLKLGDENHGIMYTGDIARRDADGCYYIVGRMKRFLKIFGLRIGLDEIENLVRAEFGVDCVCTGNDELLRIYVTDENLIKKVKTFICEKTHLFHNNVEALYIETIPRNEAGKVIFQDLQ